MLHRFHKNYGRAVTSLWLISIVGVLGALALSIYFRCDSAPTFATLFAGLVAAFVVYRQGSLIKRQLAFSTYLELDKEWNSPEMIKTRKNIYDPDDDHWNDSPLEGALELFEKLSSLFKVAGEADFICDSTLGWYAVHYFLYAREHGRIDLLRKRWGDVYRDLQNLYEYYRATEAEGWEAERMKVERLFWEQERKD